MISFWQCTVDVFFLGVLVGDNLGILSEEALQGLIWNPSFALAYDVSLWKSPKNRIKQATKDVS